MSHQAQQGLQKQQQQQYHKSGSVRHAEKRRIGTCPFADRVARISIQTYHERVPETWREENKQVCLATIVAHIKRSSDEECRGHFQVLGMGVGTKFLSEKILREEYQVSGAKNTSVAASASVLGDDNSRTNMDSHPVLSSCYGMKVRDSHAEVLARRAFRRTLALEMKCHLLGQSVTNPILTLRRSLENDSNEKVEGGDSEKEGGGRSNIIFSLAPGVTIHMYTSSAPCGNSCLKKFAKMSRERYDSTLGMDDWPKDEHEPIGRHSMHLGRFSVLVKRDSHATSQEKLASTTTKESARQEKKLSHMPIKQRKWPANVDDQWCPPGTTLPHLGRGSIQTCSDKICRWNVIGLQGSLLSSLLDAPIYMETLTIGRKFTKCIAQRAVCCRVVDGGHCSGTKRKRQDKQSQGDASSHEELLNPWCKVHHPTVMGTSVYMDDLGVLDMSGEKTIGQDVRFQSSLCWTWHPNDDEDIRFNAQCINGETGLLHCNDSRTTEKDDANKDKQIMPLVCTHALTHQFIDLARTVGMKVDFGRNHRDGGGGDDERACTTLNQLRELKCKVAPKYEDAKDELLHNHDVFYNWNRRDDSKRRRITK